MDSSFQSFSDFLKSFSWGDWWKFGQSGEVFAASAETKISSILHSYSGEGTPAGKDMMFEAVAERASWIYNESASLETEGDRVLKLVSLLTGPLQNNPNFPLFLANLTRFGSFIADKALDLADPSSSVYAVHSVAVGIESYAPAELRNTAFFDGFMGNLGALLEGLFKSLFSFGLPFMSPPKLPICRKHRQLPFCLRGFQSDRNGRRGPSGIAGRTQCPARERDRAQNCTKSSSDVCFKGKSLCGFFSIPRLFQQQQNIPAGRRCPHSEKRTSLDHSRARGRTRPRMEQGTIQLARPSRPRTLVHPALPLGVLRLGPFEKFRARR
mmetsp:Transcript_2540/g.5293  ORF Transcript_2540/g.5293 Transcript_2540/m.5293 type:complete len:325 (-) Transcript_2540:221-1195(-)